MAQSSWRQSFAYIFKRQAVVRSREPDLEFSRRCLQEVRTMTLPREVKSLEVVNYEQCVYLVDSLEKAVDAASLFLEHNHVQGGNWVSTEDVRESALEYLKILCMLAKKVKCFIQGCCNGHWLQAAVMLTNLSDCTASVGFDLKLFTVLPPYSNSRIYSSSPLSLNEISASRHAVGELVKKLASNDGDRLVTRLRALIQNGRARSGDLELATFLLERLDRFKQSLPSITPGSLGPILHERDLTNLKDRVVIGRGMHGTVHKASWLGIDVAVKSFHGTGNLEFTREASIRAGLSHPNIVSFLGHRKDMGKSCIVMELMDQDLFSLLKERLRKDRTRSSPFSVFEEFDIMLQIAEAMFYLHEMRVLHGDLKSRNILVRYSKSGNEEGYESVQVKVSGFGYSKIPESTIFMQSGMISNPGSNRWRAPELMSYRDIDEFETVEDEELVENYLFKPDVYSFGMVCLEILTGDVPFADKAGSELYDGERPHLPGRCHRQLKALIQQCWNPKASSRPSFGDICAELRYLKSLHMTPLRREPFLEFSRQCLQEVRTMTLPRRLKYSEVVNYEQCVYLVDGLEKAVDAASLFLEHNHVQGGIAVSTEDVRESALEYLKILCMLAKKVKCFIQGCCNGHWLQAVVMQTNLPDCTASVGFDLKLFTVLLPPFSASKSPLSLDEISALRHVEGELVKKMVSIDEHSVVDRLEDLIQYGQPSNDDFELATFLLERLDRFKQSLPSITPGSVHPILHERDLTNLRHMTRIGSGGYATVHKASWLGVDVAVKAFNGTDNPFFEKEVPILAGLSHPNIVSFLGHGKDRGDCLIVMELMDQDLFSLLKERLRKDRTRRSPFSRFEEFDIMLQIAEAMFYLHEMRVLHRDLKSANILVRCMKSPNAEGYDFVQVKVSDFGLSRTKEFSMTRSHMTPNMGTARWMAPELIKFRNTNGDMETVEDEGVVENYPFKCDVYSFGMVCFEILTGDMPFPNMITNEVKRAVCAGERPQLPDRCHEKLKALIEKCWRPEASSRPCFGDICAELRHLKGLHLTRLSAFQSLQNPASQIAILEEKKD